MTNNQTEPRTVRVAMAVGVPAAFASILAIIITLVAGWPANQGVGVAIAIFVVTIVPWMGLLMLRKLRTEEDAAR